MYHTVRHSDTVAGMTADNGGKPTRECAGCGEPFTPKSARQKYHSTACRKAKTAKPEPSPEDRVIAWSTAHGAPIRLLIGWDPDTGHWEADSPIANVLNKIEHGVHITVAAKQFGFPTISELLYQGAEYVGLSEDRQLIPIEVRPFADLYERISYHESGAESDLAVATYAKALRDGKLGLDFLGRRWPSRWREQQAVAAIGELDEREAAVTAVITDPTNAMALAAMAETIEDSVEETERQNA